MTNLENLGERKAIELILKQLDKMPNMPIPFGDDVTAYPLKNNQLAILKTDMLVGETDVPPKMTLQQAARKAVVMNISDFASKGIQPLALLVSLGLTRGTTEKAVAEIGEGLNAGAREYGAYVIGGDTGEASDLVISVALFGLASKHRLMLRRGARPRDIVAVTGCFGKPAAGLRILLNERKISAKTRRTLVDSVLVPHARLAEGLALSRTGAVTASIDSSDGLAWSLQEIARASNVGLQIDKIPVAKEAEDFATINKLDLSELALYGGEEYELVLTVNPSLWKKADKAVKRVGGKLLQIGEVTENRDVVLRIEERKRAIEARGYEHFRKPAL